MDIETKSMLDRADELLKDLEEEYKDCFQAHEVTERAMAGFLDRIAAEGKHIRLASQQHESRSPSVAEDLDLGIHPL